MSYGFALMPQNFRHTFGLLKKEIEMVTRSRNTDTCHHCIYWQRGFRFKSVDQIKSINEGFQPEHGECRINPPALDGPKQWPETYSEDWCGQWNGDV